jgi:hypothetical protein
MNMKPQKEYPNFNVKKNVVDNQFEKGRRNR